MGVDVFLAACQNEDSGACSRGNYDALHNGPFWIRAGVSPGRPRAKDKVRVEAFGHCTDVFDGGCAEKRREDLEIL